MFEHLEGPDGGPYQSSSFPYDQIWVPIRNPLMRTLYSTTLFHLCILILLGIDLYFPHEIVFIESNAVIFEAKAIFLLIA